MRYLSYASFEYLEKVSVIFFIGKSPPANFTFSDKVSSASSSDPDSLTVAKPSEIFVSEEPKGSFDTNNTFAPCSVAA